MEIRRGRAAGRATHSPGPAGRPLTCFCRLAIFASIPDLDKSSSTAVEHALLPGPLPDLDAAAPAPLALRFRWGASGSSSLSSSGSCSSSEASAQPHFLSRLRDCLPQGALLPSHLARLLLGPAGGSGRALCGAPNTGDLLPRRAAHALLEGALRVDSRGFENRRFSREIDINLILGCMQRSY